MKEKLAKVKQISAGPLFKAKQCCIRKDIFVIRMANVEASNTERDEIKIKEGKTYTKQKHEANDVLESGVSLKKMTNKQFLALLCPLKRKGDGAIPTLKKYTVERYDQIKHRLPLIFDSVVETVSYDHYDESEELTLTEDSMQQNYEEAAEAMVFLSE